MTLPHLPKAWSGPCYKEPMAKFTADGLGKTTLNVDPRFGYAEKEGSNVQPFGPDGAIGEECFPKEAQRIAQGSAKAAVVEAGEAASLSGSAGGAGAADG